MPSNLWVETALRMALGSSLILALALIVFRLFRRQSSATRHLIGTLACAALLLLPISLASLPSWHLGWLRSDLATMATPASKTLTGNAAARPPAISGGLQEDVGDQRSQEESLPLIIEQVSVPTALPVKTFLSDGNTSTGLADTAMLVLAGTYLLGALVLTVRMLADYGTSLRMVRRSQPLAGSFLNGEVTNCSDAMAGSRLRQVPVRTSDTASVPMVCGVLRPTMLLPAAAIHWPSDRVGAAVAHEFAHVERHDLQTQLLANVVSILYWPHPLLHLLRQLMRQEREIACDDRVVNDIDQPARYARHLLDVAAELGVRPPDAGLAMARTPDLQSRITAILSTKRSRRPPTARAIGWMTTSMLVGLMVIAMTSPFSGISSTTVIAQEPTGSEEQANQPSDDFDGSERETYYHAYTGRVLLANGQPAVRAAVRIPAIWVGFPAVETITDAQGRYLIELKAFLFHAPLIVESESGDLLGFHDLDVPPSVVAPFLRTDSFTQELPDITLRPAKQMTVHVVGKESKPIAGAAVNLHSRGCVIDRVISDPEGMATVRYPEGINLRAIVAVKAGEGCDYRLLERGFRGHSELVLNGAQTATVRVLDQNDQPLEGIWVDPFTIRKKGRRDSCALVYSKDYGRETNADGVAVFDMLPLDLEESISLSFYPRAVYHHDRFVIGNHSIGTDVVFIQLGRDNSGTARIHKTVTVGGLVRDANGQPAANIPIIATGDFKYTGRFRMTTKTDSDGRWRMPVKPDGYYLFAVQDELVAATAHAGVLVGRTDTPTDLDFELEPARRVFGQVTGRFGRYPIRIMLQQLSPSTTELPEEFFELQHDNRVGVKRFFSAFTQVTRQPDAEGRYEFHVGPGRFRIWSPYKTTQNFTITDELQREFNFNGTEDLSSRNQ